MRKSNMKRESRYQKFRRKHYREKGDIRAISSNFRDSFDRAYSAASESIQSEIKEAKAKSQVLTEKANLIQFDEDTSPSETELIVFDELAANFWLIHSNEDSLLSLAEMRIIFLFKSFENAIKEMAGIAYPKINKRDFFRWEVVASHLKSNGVEIKSLTGYQEVNQLRIVNNNIKHSQELNEETKNIQYWKDESEFTFKNLEEFYDNSKNPILVFIEALGESIIRSTYELSDEKLEEMSRELFDRLDRKQTEKLIANLKMKL